MRTGPLSVIFTLSVFVSFSKTNIRKSALVCKKAVARDAWVTPVDTKFGVVVPRYVAELICYILRRDCSDQMAEARKASGLGTLILPEE